MFRRRIRAGELQLFLDHPKAGRNQEANALLARILASDPGQLAPYALLLGGLLAQNSQFQEAVPLYQEAIRVNPGDPAAYFYLAVTYHALKDYESCDRTWDYLAATFPQHYLNHLQQALRALKQNDHQAAMGFLEKAIAVPHPRNPMRNNALQLLALVRQESQRGR